MRRRRFRKPATQVALFPFLAVLVCTMGALIVLLVLVVQQARVYATGVAQREAPPTDRRAAELRFALENSRWRGSILGEERKKLTEKLAGDRLRLSHLEDHIRRLERRWQQLKLAAGELEQLDPAAGADHRSDQNEIEQLEAQLAAARDQLERARHEAARRPRSFAIIPYTGPHGTQRRPIYIECTEGGILLQPEGVLLTAADFKGPLGPGNPLDAALRATREHLARLDPDGSEPYPLLVVRPDGALAYNVAREAMKAWDDEFGYELVDAEMQLAYPPADPTLRSLLLAAARDARQRQAILAAAMPSQFQGELANGFVARPYGDGIATVTGAGAESRAGRGGSGRSAGRPGRGSAGRAASDHRDGAVAADRATGTPAAEETGAGSGGPHASPSAGGALMPAARRGSNWALPKATPGATGVTRPIGVACYVDRLAILPENGSRNTLRVVPMPQGPAAVIDEFVSVIWEHMEQWGLAMPGGYWKPVLEVYVTPGATAQFQELERLLADSGFEVERKSP